MTIKFCRDVRYSVLAPDRNKVSFIRNILLSKTQWGFTILSIPYLLDLQNCLVKNFLCLVSRSPMDRASFLHEILLNFPLRLW